MDHHDTRVVESEGEGRFEKGNKLIFFYLFLVKFGLLSLQGISVISKGILEAGKTNGT